MSRILIVEDDETLRGELSYFLIGNGYEVSVITDFKDTLDEMLKTDTELILLDLNLPGIDGQTLLRMYRKEKNTPVIIVTSKDTEMDELICMTYGADDFVSKPFSMLELIARIRAVLRRAEPAQASGDFSLGLLFVSPDRHEVKVGGKDVTLTNKEFELLCLLLRNKGIVLTRATLMDRVWGFESERENRTLDVHIRTLRVKLGEAGSYFETVRGIGYKIDKEAKE